MTWVKVCGLTREADVEAAVDAGADALGFVLVPGSPRLVTRSKAASLMDGVPVMRIVLTLDATVAAVKEIVEETGADGVQPYGARAAAAAAWAEAAGLTVLRPVPGAAASPDAVSGVPEGQIPLIDSTTGTRHGGTGTTLDWEAMTPPDRSFVLAGGLDPHNVARAVAAVHPWGVDASSGLESSPGIKDSARVAAFVEEAKRT